MKHLRRIALVGILAAVLTAIALSLLPRNEPKFQGKYISHYLRQMELVDDGTNRDLRWAAFQDATNALQQMGLAAIDWLAKNLENPKATADSPLDRLLRRLPVQLQSFVTSQPPPDLFNRTVLSGLVHSGPAAVPVLTNYLDSARYDGSVRQEIYRALSYLPLVIDAQTAIPILQVQAQSRDDFDRVLASYALQQINTNFYPLAVSNLIAVLQKTNSFNRASAANLLGNLDPPPPEAAPVFKAFLNDTNSHVRREAERFFKQLKKREQP